MKKILYLLFFCLIIHQLSAQQKKKTGGSFNKQNKENEQFLKKQWWIGLKGGINLTKPTVEKSYSVVSPTNYQPADIGKKYESFRKLGSQVAIEVTFYFSGVSLSFQPAYRHIQFEYTNHYQWENLEVPENRLELFYHQTQKVDYIDLPLIVKYEIAGDKIRPYVQLGAYSALLVNANKEVSITRIDYASGGTNTTDDEAIIVGATDLFAKKHWGWLAGAGVYYNVGNIRLNLDVQYKMGMSNISSTKNRYSSDRLSGVGDAMDDLQTNTLAISVGCLFPMRFLESGFKSLDRK
jgi:hypothetical protein